MEKVRVLIADEDKKNKVALSKLLVSVECAVSEAGDSRATIELLQTEHFDLVIADQDSPASGGLELIGRIKDIRPDIRLIIMSANGSIPSSVQAMKLGALDYLVKPLSRDYLFPLIQKISASLEASKSFVPVPETPPNNDHVMKFVGSSDCMLRIFESIQKVAKSDSTVVIYGESGTGKELVARAIHMNSDRRDFPLVAVNCGAIPEDLLESELFGHEKGAFTGAIRTRIGRFERAERGTIFLDEIGDMTMGLQVKLLRVIQERQFERIGGAKTISADVRIVAATNQELEKAVAEKRFREDLFYRINVIPMLVPPLRERTEDIPELSNYFLARFCKLKRKTLSTISEEAMRMLQKYPWPGNVRELENMMEMLVVMNDEGVISPDLLPPRVHAAQMAAPSNMVDFTEAGCNLNELVSNFEKELIQKALRLSGGVKSQAAKMLMLNRTTLVEKLKRFNLEGMEKS